MKYQEFSELCAREWLAAEGYGDVTGLSLAGESLSELTADVLTNPPGDVVTSFPAGPVAGGCGAILTNLPNPVTRSTVTVILNADAEFSDTATVNYGPLASPPTRTVTV